MDEVSPLQYAQKTGAGYAAIAELTGCSYDAVKAWFAKPGTTRHRKPGTAVLRLLAADLKIKALQSGRR